MKAFWKDTQETIQPNELKVNGIDYQVITTENYESKLNQLKRKNGYAAHDVIELNPSTPNLDIILAKFDKEHLHTDDEVRFVIDGSGVFEVRALDNRWMHIEVHKGDYICVPANRWHLFYCTEEKFMRCVRLFKENPSWTPVYRAPQETQV